MRAELLKATMVERDCPHCGRTMEKLGPMRDPTRPLTWALYWNCHECPAAPAPGKSYAHVEYVEEPP